MPQGDSPESTEGSDSCSWPVFHERWWLDAVAPDSWQEITVETDGEVTARMPFVVRRKLGLNIVEMPHLTQVLGPWIKPQCESHLAKLSREKSLMNALIDGLPRFDMFCQNFDHSIANWLPFYWRGFEQTTRYTYVLRDLSNVESVYFAISPQKRRDISKAIRIVGVEEDLDPSVFYSKLTESIRSRGGTMTYDEDYFRRVYESAYHARAGKSFFAIDANRHIHAAALVVWNTRSAYLLVTMIDPEFRASCSLSLIIWEAVKFAASRTQAFDFEGSMAESVEKAYRYFGAEQVPYMQICKGDPLRIKISSTVRRSYSWACRRLARIVS